MKVMKEEWLLRVAKTSNAVAQERNFQKDQPHPEDIQKLSNFVKACVNLYLRREKTHLDKLCSYCFTSTSQTSHVQQKKAR